MSKKLSDYLVEPSWRYLLSEEFEKDYFKDIEVRYEQDKNTHTIYPPKEFIFDALNLCPFDKTKVVIIGQDPYHGEKQANGLAFSVNKNVKIPPSLKNIFKELNNCIEDFESPDHGDLSSWAKQGVLLLNSSLTVIKSQAGSHSKIGWQIFTDRLVNVLKENKENLVFILWGSHAQKKAAPTSNHYVLKSVHPSPLSAHRGFFNNNHFSKANKYLKSHNLSPIAWSFT